MQILFCDTLLSVRIVYYVKVLVNLIRFLIPLGLLFKITLDLYKGIISANDEKSELIKKTGTRITAAVIIFLIPTFIGLFLSLINEFTDTSSYKDSFYSCYKSADSDLIKELEEKE
ncbi:MAG: hypothetical protein IKN63_02055 [Bacilli bacterium]|nr:hypothetical protein [Bacilli bacterium]